MIALTSAVSWQVVLGILGGLHYKTEEAEKAESCESAD